MYIQWRHKYIDHIKVCQAYIIFFQGIDGILNTKLNQFLPHFAKSLWYKTFQIKLVSLKFTYNINQSVLKW